MVPLLGCCGVLKCRGGLRSLGAAARSAASILQGFIEPVQLVAEVAEFVLFRSQLLLGVYLSRLQLLFLVFQRLKSCLELRKLVLLKFFPSRGGILCAVYGIFEPLEISGHLLPLILNSRELLPGFIETLRGAPDGRLLPLQPIDEELRSLRRYRRGLQVLPQLSYLRQQSLKRLRITCRCLPKTIH